MSSGMAPSPSERRKSSAEPRENRGAMPERNYFATEPRRRPFRALARAFGIAVLVVAVLGAGWFVFLRDAGGPPALPSAQLDAYLKAWQAGDANTMAAQLNLPPADL